MQSRLESSEQTCNREIDAKNIIVSELSELRVEARDSRNEVDETRTRLQRRASIYESEMLALRDDLVKARSLKSKSMREAKARHEAELIRLRVRHSAEFDELNSRIRNVLGNKQRAIENLRSELSTALSRVRDLDGILSDGDDDDDLDARFLRGNDSSFDSRDMKRYAK